MISPLSVAANTALATVSRGFSIAASFMSVPLLLSLLGRDNYGAWVTLSSLTAAISLLDLGFGNSLRNSVASSNHANLSFVRREFISFFRVLLLAGVLGACIFVAILPHTSFSLEEESAALTLYLPLLLLIPVLLGSSVLQGARAYGIQAFLQSSSSILFVASIWIFSVLSVKPSLPQIAAIWISAYVLPALASIYLAARLLGITFASFFRRPFLSFPPNRLRVGIKFFSLQITSIILFNLGNILIYRHLGSSEVTRYDTLSRLFGTALSFYTIYIGVSWAEISSFSVKADANALWATFYNLLKAALLFTVLCFFGSIVAPSLIYQWTGGVVRVHFLESIVVASCVSLQAFALVGAVFMNAFEKVGLQIWIAVISALVLFPLSTFFFIANLGIASVPLALMILTLLPVVLFNLNAVRLLRGVVATPILQ
jgi:O-antigen/teichoic acid export membrane protein